MFSWRWVAGNNEPNYPEYMECFGSLGSDDSHKQRPIQLLNLSTYTGYRLYFPISVKGSLEELSERLELGRLLWRLRKTNKASKTKFFVSPKNVIFIAIPDSLKKQRF